MWTSTRTTEINRASDALYTTAVAAASQATLSKFCNAQHAPHRTISNALGPTEMQLS